MAQAVDITALLQAAQSQDAATRQRAEEGLEQLKAQLSTYLLSLSAHLSNEHNPIDTRRLAGLQLKNALDARDEARKAALAAQWLSLDAGLKQQVRGGILATLGAAAPDVRHTAALVVAKVAAIDIPGTAWPDLIPTLLRNAEPGSPPGLRQATLAAIGYVTEELGALEEDYLDQAQVNAILTAVVSGMRAEEGDAAVRLAATVALNNALEFAAANFGNDAERNYLMQVVCQATLAGDARVRKAAWECLVRIAEGHYERLPMYMPDIFNLSQQAVRGGDEDVALQALEFWCTVAEEEASRGEAGAGAGPGEASSGPVCHRFVAAALPQLVPLLLEQLSKQEEGQESEDTAHSLALMAGTALGLAASAVGDAVVDLVMPYVQANIQAARGGEDWRLREAATFAFGSIMSGPSAGKLEGLVRMGLPFLLTALKDPHPQVKNTTAWTIGRIFEFVGSEEVSPPLLGPDTLPAVVQALLEALRDEPHIAEKVCYAVSQLAQGFRDAGAGASPLSPHFKGLVGALLEAAARPLPAAEAVRLQTQAFEAVNDLVRASAPADAALVVQLLPVVLGKLNAVLAATAAGGAAAGSEAAERHAELAGLLCGMLTVTVQQLAGGGEGPRQLALQYADAVVEALLRVYAALPGAAMEATLAVGAATAACGPDFEKYLPPLFPHLEAALLDHRDRAACIVAVGVVSDVCRAVERGVLPYADRLMMVLLRNLASDEVHREVKPHILSVFGDVALAVEDAFEVYLAHVIQMLQSAAALSATQRAAAAGGDEEAGEYNAALRQAILEAWAGMFNGLSQAKANQYLSQYAPSLIEFVEAIAADGEAAGEPVLKAAAAALGDIASKLAGVGVLFQQKPFWRPFLQRCTQLNDMEDVATWAAMMCAKAEAAARGPQPA